MPWPGDDHRLLDRLDLVVQQVVAAVVAAEVPARVLGLGLRVARARPDLGAEIHPGGEVLAGAGDDQAAQVVAHRQQVERLPQRRRHLRRDRVELLLAVEGDGEDAVVLGDRRVLAAGPSAQRQPAMGCSIFMARVASASTTRCASISTFQVAHLVRRALRHRDDRQRRHLAGRCPSTPPAANRSPRISANRAVSSDRPVARPGVARARAGSPRRRAAPHRSVIDTRSAIQWASVAWPSASGVTAPRCAAVSRTSAIIRSMSASKTCVLAVEVAVERRAGDRLPRRRCPRLACRRSPAG